MSFISKNLRLPFIAPAQAQKHVTHNEAIRALDAIVQLSVLDRDLTNPPASPNEGDRYIIAASATGDWLGKDNQIAAFQDGAWMFYQPNEGWLVWIVDENKLLAWDGTIWVIAGGDGINPVPLVGVNATADTTNRLSISSPASLFNHEGASHQVKVNKNLATDTASVLFQTNWSGRAEFGLTGDNDWHVKTSPDGSAWNEALIADSSTGAVRFPAGLEHASSRLAVSTIIETPGADGTTSIYRNDTLRNPLPRTATISSITNDLITLTTADANLFFNDNMMNGVSFIRIWNISKNPGEEAWVKASPSNNQLQVTDTAAISSWSATDTVQIGETGLDGGTYVPLDISPMMQNLFGVIFRQSGIVLKSGVAGSAGGQAKVWAGDSTAGGASLPIFSDADGSFGVGMLTVPCSEKSPISNSNLVWVKEAAVNQLTTTLFSSKFLFVK